MSHEISFDEAAHRYTVGGRTIPSVTQILQRMYTWDNIPNAVLENARDRGQGVHKACELWDYDTLDEQDLDHRLAGYVEAWNRFKTATGFIVTHSEQRFFSERLKVCGTPDRVGIMTEVAGRPHVVLEIKATCRISPVAGLQTAGYHLLLRDNGVLCDRRYVVQLLPSALYVLKEFASPLDIPVFMGELASYQWRIRNAGK